MKLTEYLDAARRKFVEDALAATGGNVTAAARLTGTPRTHLTKLMKRYGIKSSLQQYVKRERGRYGYLC